jgi:hypothetical protein
MVKLLMRRAQHRWAALARAVALGVGMVLLPWPVRAQGAAYQGPLVDSHAHLDRAVGVPSDSLLALYDANGVRGGWVFGVPWQEATEAWQRYPDRVVPFLAEGYADTLGAGSSYRNPAGLDDLLAGGYVRGLGEVILRHSPFRLSARVGGGEWPATNVPADHPDLLAAYAIAGRHRAPVVVHQEAAFAAELERAVQAAPDTPLVWAHAGHGSPSVVRPLLARNSNLHADLSARTPWLGAGTVLTRADGSLDPEWAALLADYPDRFLVGLDLFAPGQFRPDYVRDTVDYYRGLLGRLAPAQAEQIGYRNAERLAPFVVPPRAP